MIHDISFINVIAFLFYIKVRKILLIPDRAILESEIGVSALQKKLPNHENPSIIHQCEFSSISSFASYAPTHVPTRSLFVDLPYLPKCWVISKYIVLRQSFS